jgi:hypothetical protein
MRVLMIPQHMNLFRNLEPVVRKLDERGHETVVLHGTRLDDPKLAARIAAKREKMVFQGRGIEVAEAELASLRTGYRPEPEDSPRHRRKRLGRQVINRSLYLHKSHPAPERSVAAVEKGLPADVRRRLDRRAVRWLLGTRLPLRAWRRFERISAPSERVTAVLRELDPDVVLVSPSVWPKDPVEADYVHAARRLGIPTICYVNSWDNLTSKGTVHVLPDAFIVWNEAMATEAREIHQIPANVVRVTGAPHLDHFFEREPSLSRGGVCRRLGCPEDAPYVVYLCSSRTLIADETDLVTRLADALARRLAGAAPTVVVRPHPVNPDPWEGYEHPGTVVYPKHGDQADTDESWQDYFNQLAFAACFVGLNTTAFLEAAVADRPCLTLASDETFDQQGRTGHFRHLLDAGFLELSKSEDELADRIARVLAGEDENAGPRRRFKADFLRPRGIGIPARSVVADTIEELAVSRSSGRLDRVQGPGPVPVVEQPAAIDEHDAVGHDPKLALVARLGHDERAAGT